MMSFRLLCLACGVLCFTALPVRAETNAVTRSPMSMFQAAVLGVVEGVTEYLPVSSTAHLLLAQRAMGIGQTRETSEAAEAYAVCIQVGAILAVVGLYFGRVRQMTEGLLGRNPEGFKLGLNVVTAFLPAAIIGLAFEKAIKSHLFGLWPVVGAWLVGGIVILIVDRLVITPRRRDGRGRSLTEITWKMAVFIGLVQCLAMWPGTSRSLATILGGLFAGLNLGAAIEFSFLLGLVTLSAATVHDANKYGGAMIHAYGWLAPAVFLGLFFAMLCGTKVMLAVIAGKSRSFFSGRTYRIILGMLSLSLVVFAGFLIRDGLRYFGWLAN